MAEQIVASMTNRSMGIPEGADEALAAAVEQSHKTKLAAAPHAVLVAEIANLRAAGVKFMQTTYDWETIKASPDSENGGREEFQREMDRHTQERFLQDDECVGDPYDDEGEFRGVGENTNARP